MDSTEKKVRGLGLCSGGLDSMLAGLVLREQGIYVEWIAFTTPFFSEDKAHKASRQTGIALTVKDITKPYLEMLKNPPCGYGKHMNPCMDCHTMMFRIAGQVMQARGFDFLFSGEVLGQRPMSQTRSSLRYVEKHSGFSGYIIRPLSAQRLDESIPEKNGLVDRDKLLGLTGRTRKPQIKLARQFGIDDYPAPAGGCLLTDPGYAGRLRDLFDHQTEVTVRELELLKHGRHFRLDANTKLIVGRTKADNEKILQFYDAGTDVLIKVQRYPGPLAVLPRGAAEDKIKLAAAVCVGYSKAPNLSPTPVQASTPDGKQIIEMLGIAASDIGHLMIKT